MYIVHEQPSGGLSQEACEQAAECLKVLAHPQRLKLLSLLLQEKRPVGDLARLCALAPHVTSEHLKLLERCGFLSGSRVGRQVFYEVIEPHVAELLACMERRFGAEAVTKEK
jgi:DNA-binding transcriptional ArsR family regulator